MIENQNDSPDKETNFANESDSKISINFNINNNYLLKNEIQNKRKSKRKIIQEASESEIVFKTGITADSSKSRKSLK